MATYEDALNAAFIFYRRHQEMKKEYEAVKERFGEHTCNAMNAKVELNEQMIKVHGQIQLICEMYDKGYYTVLSALKGMYNRR